MADVRALAKRLIAAGYTREQIRLAIAMLDCDHPHAQKPDHYCVTCGRRVVTTRRH